MSDIDKQVDEVLHDSMAIVVKACYDVELNLDRGAVQAEIERGFNQAKDQFKALIEREVREARIDEVNRAEVYPDEGLRFRSEDEYGNPVLVRQADRIKQLRGDTFLTLPDDEKHKVLKKAVKKANEEQRELLENRSSDWLDEVVQNIANFYSKREFTLDDGDYVGVEKAKRDIRKHIGRYLKTIAENNGAYIIDGEAYGITKVDSIKAPLGGDDE